VRYNVLEQVGELCLIKRLLPFSQRALSIEEYPLGRIALLHAERSIRFIGLTFEGLSDEIVQRESFEWA
jgi:hypothetical protein